MAAVKKRFHTYTRVILRALLARRVTRRRQLQEDTPLFI